MNKLWVGFALAFAAGIVPAAGAGGQAAAALTASELNHCATRVATLRAESARLNAQAVELDRRRAALERRRQRLDTDARRADGSKSHGPWMRYNADAAALNKDVAGFRDDVAAVNRIKRAYAGECAGHPYSHADLQALPAALRAAMRAGLADVQVPYAGDPDTPAQ